MWYILSMNKDVIYIEPEDDITDIIKKLESSKEKIVALVPPEKAGVLRSVVNIKLISKSAANNGKTVVLVTTDEGILRLAAATHIPVTKDLQTAPSIPSLEKEETVTVVTETVAEDATEVKNIKSDKDDEPEKHENRKETEDEELENDDEDLDENTKEDDDAKIVKKAKKTKSISKNPIIAWVQTHKKLAILCAIGLGLLVLALVWAFVIAPAVTIAVTIRTTSNNFSENVSFVAKLEEEDAANGIFYLEEKKSETPSKYEFKATGTKNIGEKATGAVIVYKYFRQSGTAQIAAGSTFTYDGHAFIANEGAALSYDGNGLSSCNNKEDVTILTSGCLISARVPVTAAESGTEYNISASNKGWRSDASIDGVYSDAAMSGGTDQTVTVVSEEDVKKAKEELLADNNKANKQTFIESQPEGLLIIESSFKQSTTDVTVSPAIGEEAKDGKASISTTTTMTVYAVDKTKIEEFIKAKAKLGDDQKIYSINNPFIENFSIGDDKTTGKLKTAYASGPQVTENDIVENAKGKGLGDVQHDLKSINGVSSVSIEKSFFWVNSVPTDTAKITIKLEVEEKKENN